MGNREGSGFNLDWLKKLLGHKSSKPAVVEQQSLQIGFPQDLEKDDPYADLGYKR